MHTLSIAVNSALLQEIERSRGKMTRSAYLSGLVRAALDAKLPPLPAESFRGRLRHSDRLGGFRRAIARKGEVQFSAFADLFARMLAPVEIIGQGPGSVAWAANQLINEGLFEWTPSGMVRIPLGAPKRARTERNTLAGWSEIIAAQGQDLRPRRERLGLEPGEHYQGCPLAGISDDVSCCP